MFKYTAAHMRKASVLGIAVVAACGFFSRPPEHTVVSQPTPARTAAVSQPTPRSVVFTKASASMPSDTAGVRVYKAAKRFAGAKILVSTEDRWLWFVLGKDTLLSAPVAIGMGKNFEFNGKKYNFSTPRGRRKVLKKEENPIWTVPEWHYWEKASERGLQVVNVKAGEIYPLQDGTWIQIKDGEVGRVNQFGNFWPFTPGIEIIFEDKLYIPPRETPQRKVPNALGPFKLDMGEGYLIHGTHEYNEMSIGEAASHGCVRMRNEDVERLYSMAETGTPVFIF